MKKTIVGGLAIAMLLTGNNYVNASDSEILTETPTLYDTAISTDIMTTTSDIQVDVISDLYNKYDIVLRNNIVVEDMEFNNVNYYTKKINTSNIVIPDEIKEKAKKMYFLIEEQSNGPIFYNKTMDESMGNSVENVKTEYNYKKVDVDSIKGEYTFNTKDLVKELKEDEYKSVSIMLVAEIEEGKEINLSNSVYIYLSNKEATLTNLLAKENENFYNEYVYNADDIEKYLETVGAKMTRNEYKKLINGADVKITKMLKTTTEKKTKLLESIQKEEDFKSNLAKYKENFDSLNLLNNLSSAVKSQAYNIKTFDTIDAILK